MGQIQDDFLRRAAAAASDAGHIFPDYAASEAALESAWGLSQLSVLGNNLFGQKQVHPPPLGARTLTLPTREYLQGEWVSVAAGWVGFADWTTCFRERMNTLRRLSRMYPHYAAALAARSGENFIEQVSLSWSTDPARAGKVLSLYDCHRSAFNRQRNGSLPAGASDSIAVH